MPSYKLNHKSVERENVKVKILGDITVSFIYYKEKQRVVVEIEDTKNKKCKSISKSGVRYKKLTDIKKSLNKGMTMDGIYNIVSKLL